MDVDVREVDDAVQVVVLVLISIAAIVAQIIVWRDDHHWTDRPNY